MAQTLTQSNISDHRPEQSIVYRGLHDIAGRRFSHSYFPIASTGAVLDWVERQIASRFGCLGEDVLLIEGDDGGEMIVVFGKPVAFLTNTIDWCI